MINIDNHCDDIDMETMPHSRMLYTKLYGPFMLKENCIILTKLRLTDTQKGKEQQFKTKYLNCLWHKYFKEANPHP